MTIHAVGTLDILPGLLHILPFGHPIALEVGAVLPAPQSALMQANVPTGRVALYALFIHADSDDDKTDL